MGKMMTTGIKHLTDNWFILHTIILMQIFILGGNSIMAQPVTLIHSEDPGLQPPPVILSPAPELYGPQTRVFQGIPGIERASNGRLWATWYGGGPTEGPWNYVMLNTSDDDGVSWTELKVVIDPPGQVRAFDPCLWSDPLGRMWFFWAQAIEFWDGRAGVWAIVTENPEDENPDWSAPRRLSDGIMMNKPTVLSNGEWVLPVAIWAFPPHNIGQPIEEANIRTPEIPNASNIVVSTDEGKTWSYRGGVDIPGRSCDEHMVVERGDGTLWMMARTPYGIGESISRDRGYTWETPRHSWIPHVSTARFFIRHLDSGRVLLVKHSPPDGRTRSHLTAYLSEDDGFTWVGRFMIDDRTGVSYPDGVQADDGTIYIIYDYSRYNEKQILMATFTEQDILAEADVSDKVRRQVLVHQATGTPETVDAPELSLKSHDDGHTLIVDSPATLTNYEGEWASFKSGEVLFSNRNYTIGEIPDSLAGSRFLRSSIDTIKATCESAGVVWVLTPQPERNNDSLELELYRNGFQKAALPEFILFDQAYPNACTLFQKQVHEGEKIDLGKWGVLLLPATQKE